jgi:CRP-like cAMP-binding protein
MSVSAVQPEAANRLIAGLPRQDRGRLLRCCEQVELAVGEILCEADRSFRYVYFPLTGLISLVKTVDGDRPLEMGSIGNEGVLGVTLVLGIDAAPLRGLVRCGGIALRTTALQLRQEIHASPALRRMLNRYLYVLMGQWAQATACTHFHEIELQLTRRLLMAHDRADADHFHLTHQVLAEMLGVQRSAITIAAGALQQRKLIRYTRGEITVLSRRGLEAASCECYGAGVERYREMFP